MQKSVLVAEHRVAKNLQANANESRKPEVTLRRALERYLAVQAVMARIRTSGGTVAGLDGEEEMIRNRVEAIEVRLSTEQ